MEKNERGETPKRSEKKREGLQRGEISSKSKRAINRQAPHWRKKSRYHVRRGKNDTGRFGIIIKWFLASEDIQDRNRIGKASGNIGWGAQ